MAVHLVCEGPRHGLDERVLNAVVIQHHNLAVLTSPIGGSSALGAVSEYIESRSVNDVAVAVEDRNRGVSFGMAPPAPPVGANAPGQPEWLPALLREAARLSQACAAVAGLPPLQSAEITARYHVLVTHYQQRAFLTSGDHLREIGGHELIAALSRHLHNLGAGARFRTQFLSDELLRLLEPIYRPNILFQPDDFDELAAILRSVSEGRTA